MELIKSILCYGVFIPIFALGVLVNLLYILEPVAMVLSGVIGIARIAIENPAASLAIAAMSFIAYQSYKHFTK